MRLFKYSFLASTQAKKFHLALKQYERAVDLVSASSISKDEDKDMVAPVYRMVKLNVAAVHLQMKNYERAKDACEAVRHISMYGSICTLLLFQVLEKEKENTKGLYRRGQVRVLYMYCCIVEIC